MYIYIYRYTQEADYMITILHRLTGNCSRCEHNKSNIVALVFHSNHIFCFSVFPKTHSDYFAIIHVNKLTE